jgi:class 3 adenylate cyclase
MAVKHRTPAGAILLISICAGILISFGYDPLYSVIDGLLKDHLKLGQWQDIISTAILGSVYLGLLIYFFSITVAWIISKNILNYLIKELHGKELLPVAFKVKKSRGFKYVYDDIKRVFDIFVQLFLSVKQDKDKFSKAVEMHLDPTVKQQLDDRNIHEMYMGTKKKTATILFCDMRGFTALTEYQDPNNIVTILNKYLSVSTKIINKNKGKVNKYMGDAILAVFEAAPKYSDYLDPDKAIISALDIQTQFQFLLKDWKEKIDPVMNIGLGIGLARGEVIAGTVGSEERMEYTVIGDTVNFASRLCSMAMDGQVLISDDIYKLVEHLVVVDVLPPVEVKGKRGRYNLYSVKTRKMIVE